MKYRICKQFEVENGHLLTKHPERCRFPHGHTRRIEVVLEADELDERDMVVDFKALKLAAGEFIDQYDHAMCINTSDPLYPALVEKFGGPCARIIPYEGQDPTSEVMARQIFDFLAARLQGGGVIRNETGVEYRLSPSLRLRSVRHRETTTSWAEVEAD